MKYLCLVYVAGAKFDAMSESELHAIQDEAMANDNELRASGHFVVGLALQPVTAATTIRVRNGKLSATDGPFAETTEQLAGFILVEARDLNEAISIAGRNPFARIGSLEVRPEMDMTEILERVAS